MFKKRKKYWTFVEKKFGTFFSVKKIDAIIFINLQKKSLNCRTLETLKNKSSSLADYASLMVYKFVFFIKYCESNVLVKSKAQYYTNMSLINQILVLYVLDLSKP